ncbi:hypothetical protein K490DRAFT_63088 [Saccharata proteae CBS 121410]|uniref:RING-type domain-containing protein n=1 Tax=Saccharata proteae CBS 121410 TaxID=1314787 RepID=A0A9P4HZC5_9PEZI|nr:hypothetical protein K490DRAFT_63088 [Saccharata proteae CBS 121410]
MEHTPKPPPPSWWTFLAEGLRPASHREIAEEHDRKCAICMNPFCRDGEDHDDCGELYEHPIKILACQRHYFGWSCLMRWLRTSNKCPICRNELFNDSTRIAPPQNDDNEHDDVGDGLIDGQVDNWADEWDVQAVQGRGAVFEVAPEVETEMVTRARTAQAELDAQREPSPEYTLLQRWFRERFFWFDVSSHPVTFSQLDHEIADEGGFRRHQHNGGHPVEWLEPVRLAPSGQIRQHIINMDRIMLLQDRLAERHLQNRSVHFFNRAYVTVVPDAVITNFDSIVAEISYPCDNGKIRWHFNLIRCRIVQWLVRHGVHDRDPEELRAELICHAYPSSDVVHEVVEVLGSEDEGIRIAWEQWWEMARTRLGLRLDSIVARLRDRWRYSSIYLLYGEPNLLSFLFLVITLTIAHNALENEAFAERHTMPNPRVI